MLMKIGLIGFGKTGKSVASILLENKKFCLEWVLRQSTVLEHRSVPEFFGVQSDEPGLIYSSSKTSIEELLDKHPVDIIIDFSSHQGIYTYGEVAAKKKVKIISAISHYKDKELQFFYKKINITKSG